MSHITYRILAVSLFSLATLRSQDAGLPIKRVVLYKNGIGYFEHQGLITGNQDVERSSTISKDSAKT